MTGPLTYCTEAKSAIGTISPALLRTLSCLIVVDRLAELVEALAH